MFKSIIGNFNRIIEELLKNSLNKNELACKISVDLKR